MAGGLALFIIALNPHGGDADHVPVGLALTATGATALGIVVMVVRRPRDRIGSGTYCPLRCCRRQWFRAHRVPDQGGRHPPVRRRGGQPLHDLGDVRVGRTGVASVVLVQAALHSGTLVDAQPGITLLDPLVSVLWGTVVLDESTQTGPSLLLAALGFAIIVAAVFSLANPAALQADATG